MRLVLAGLLLVMFVPALAFAQTDSPEHVTSVTIEADDGLAFVGDYYVPVADGPVPGVLLLHMLDGNRSAWEPLIPMLLDAGIAVFNVDMRGHGETGGSRDWSLIDSDLALLLDWLKAQEETSDVATIGGSIGANSALRGAANDAEVVTAVALSPGLDYRGVTTADAIEMMDERPILLVASRDDNPAGPNTLELFSLTSGDAQIRMYSGRRHGTNLLPDNEALMQAIVGWLVEQFGE